MFCDFCFVRIFSELNCQAPSQLNKVSFINLLSDCAEAEAVFMRRIAAQERLSVEAKRASEVARTEL